MLRLGTFEIDWLEGGRFQIDGGCMFGVVPKILWQKKWPAAEDNTITLANAVLLIRTPKSNLIIDTGLGNKLSAKQQKIFQLHQEWAIPQSLKKFGLSRHDIDHVILTHGDFDHAGGITMLSAQGETTLTFPQAIHYLQEQEWQDISNPNRRSANTYWPINFNGLTVGKNLHLIEGEEEILPGVRLCRTGGHTQGHQAIWLESAGQHALHMGDLLPSTAYGNPLWITAYDNFPLESIAAKEKLLSQASTQKAWLLLYHDPHSLACKFDNNGQLSALIPAGEKNAP